MKNFLRSFATPLRPVSAKWAVIVLIIAILGFADSAYLTFEHYKGTIPPCTIVEGCEIVMTSAYSTILGVPVALGGVIFYLLVAIGAFAYLEGRHERMFRYALALTFAGFLFTLWFLFVQAVLLKSYCLYCLGSALTSTLLLILSVVIIKKHGAGQLSPTDEEIKYINN